VEYSGKRKGFVGLNDVQYVDDQCSLEKVYRSRAAWN